MEGETLTVRTGRVLTVEDGDSFPEVVEATIKCRSGDYTVRGDPYWIVESETGARWHVQERFLRRELMRQQHISRGMEF